jgi:hypothetical protein
MADSRVIDAETLHELQRLARSQPRSGRQAQAKASALRTIEQAVEYGYVARNAASGSKPLLRQPKPSRSYLSPACGSPKGLISAGVI